MTTFLELTKYLLLSIVFLCSHSATAETSAGCIKHEAHDGITYLLVDRSDNLKHAEGLKQTLISVREMVKPGSRLVIGASTDKSSDTRIILDLVRPKKDIWESPLKVKARERAFNECINSVESSLLADKESYAHSAILETLGFVGKVVAAGSGSSKRIVLQSDMVQNSLEISFFSAKTIDPEAMLKQAAKTGLIPALTGVEIYVAGAGQGVAEQKARQIEQFWSKFWEKSGAVLKFYGPVLPGVAQ